MSAPRHLPSVELRMRLAGVFVALGLAVEWFSLRTTTPTTFMIFTAALVVCLPIGMLLYLSTLFSKPVAPPEPPTKP